jgi:AcrR family transcriptional regulator
VGTGEQTRQEIIRKAAPIFNRKGYDGDALSDLMRATGLEKGGIYRHFESKQELAEQAFDHAWKLALDTRFEGTEGIPNSVERLKQIIRNFRDRRSGLVPGGCPLLNTGIDSDDGISDEQKRLVAKATFYLHGPSRPDGRRTVIIHRSVVPHGNESSWLRIESGAGRAGGAAEWPWT